MKARFELSALNLRQYAGTVVSGRTPIGARTIPMHGTVFAGNASSKRAAGLQAFETNTTASIRSMPNSTLVRLICQTFAINSRKLETAEINY